MIRAAIELGGTILILGGIGIALLYSSFYLRKAIRQLKREEANDEKTNGAA